MSAEKITYINHLLKLYGVIDAETIKGIDLEKAGYIIKDGLVYRDKYLLDNWHAFNLISIGLPGYQYTPA